jgi:peptidoglycan hydrolase-like protein with peptidoglycan-binding domain
MTLEIQNNRQTAGASTNQEAELEKLTMSTAKSETLEMGDRGDSVREMQVKLNKVFKGEMADVSKLPANIREMLTKDEVRDGKLLPLKDDGIYGKGTEGRVKLFQEMFKGTSDLDALTGGKAGVANGRYDQKTSASVDYVLESGAGRKIFKGAEQAVASEKVIAGEKVEVSKEVAGDVNEIRSAMTTLRGTDEAKLFEVLSRYSGNVAPLEKAYQEKYNENLKERIGKEIENPYQKKMVEAVFEGNQAQYEAYERAGELERGYKSALGVNEKVIVKALAGTTPEQRSEALAAFRDIETSRGREGDFAKAVNGDFFATDVEKQMIASALSQGSIHQYQELYYSVVKGDFGAFRDIVNNSTTDQLTDLQRKIALEYDVTDFSNFAHRQLDRNPMARNNMLNEVAVNKLSRVTFKVTDVPPIVPF